MECARVRARGLWLPGEIDKRWLSTSITEKQRLKYLLLTLEEETQFNLDSVLAKNCFLFSIAPVNDVDMTINFDAAYQLRQEELLGRFFFESTNLIYECAQSRARVSKRSSSGARMRWPMDRFPCKGELKITVSSNDPISCKRFSGMSMPTYGAATFGLPDVVKKLVNDRRESPPREARPIFPSNEPKSAWSN